MRILEVRDGFIKIESNEKQVISSFLEMKDFDKKFVAQVIQSRKFEESYISFAKVLFLYDGTFNALNGVTPTKDAIISKFSMQLMQESFNLSEPVVIGKYWGSAEDFVIGKSALDKKLLVSIDSPQKINILVTNLAKKIVENSKTLVIDMLGVMDASVKSRAAVDFKLPLNVESLKFIYEDCLTDATSDSKSLVKEIFADLGEYAKTVDFVPFKVLKTIVDEMVEKSHIFKLLVLKNKLAKFDKAGYFAVTQEELMSLKKVLNSKSAVLDLSSLSSQFQNRYLTFIYNELSKVNYDGQVFVIASNAIDKLNIKNILQNKDISSAFVTHSRFKYLKDFKSLFVNYLVEPTFSNNEIFKSYSMFLNNMPKESLLFVGDSTKFLPIVFEQSLLDEASPFDDVIELDNIEEKNIVVSLENDFQEPEKDSQIKAIEKKSEDLIEKISEDIDSTSLETLFEDEDVENEDESEVLDSKTSDFEPEKDLSQSFEAENEFHTVVDETRIEDLESDDKSEEELTYESVEDNNESLDSEIISEVDCIEIDGEIIDEASVIKEPVEEIVSQKEADDQEVLEEIEIPSDLSEINDFEDVEAIEEIQEVSTEDQIEETITEYIATEVIPSEQEGFEQESVVDLEEDNLDLDGEIVTVDIVDPEEEALNKEIIEDVDKVFTTMKDDSLSEADLDLIDELNEESAELDSNSELEELVTETLEEVETTDFEELTDYVEEELEEQFIEPLEELTSNDDSFDEEVEVLETRASSTPIVPVYEADIPQEDMVTSDPIEQGDTVTHAKYGVGVVEKMIKYGSKTLFSINFDNVGRRLLDPTLTEIKKA